MGDEVGDGSGDPPNGQRRLRPLRIKYTVTHTIPQNFKYSFNIIFHNSENHLNLVPAPIDLPSSSLPHPHIQK